MDSMLLTDQIAALEAQLAEYEALSGQYEIYHALTGKIRFCQQVLITCLKEAAKNAEKIPHKPVRPVKTKTEMKNPAPLPKIKTPAARKVADKVKGAARGRPVAVKPLAPAQEVKKAFSPRETLTPHFNKRVLTIGDIIPIEWNLTTTYKKVFVFLFNADGIPASLNEIHTAYADKEYCEIGDHMAVLAVLKNLQRILKRFGRDILIYSDKTACLDAKTLHLFQALLEVHA